MTREMISQMCLRTSLVCNGGTHHRVKCVINHVLLFPGEDDLVDVAEKVTDVASKWRPLGLALRLKSSVLETIYSDHRNNTTECLRDMLLA